jgi:hypothetical protein
MLKFFDADLDPGPGIFWPWIRNLGWKNRIRDKHPVSAKLDTTEQKESRNEKTKSYYFLDLFCSRMLRVWSSLWVVYFCKSLMKVHF